MTMTCDDGLLTARRTDDARRYRRRRGKDVAPAVLATAVLVAVVACSPDESADPAASPSQTDPAASGEPAANGTATGQPTDEELAELQRDTDALCDTGVTGVQVMVGWADAEPAFATCGVADVDTGEPVPENSYYRAGSNGKTFVATVILQLAEEGELSLDDTVDDYLPGVVKGKGHDGTAITLRNLLQHTSGIFEHTEDEDHLGDIFSSPKAFERRRFDGYEPEEHIAVAMRHKPMFQPGESWEYTNTGYVLLGMVIEAVTGNTWADEVTSRIVEPLGLTQTIVAGPPDSFPKPHAKGYTLFESGELIDTTVHNLALFGNAAGDITMVPTDNQRFFQALLGGELLEPESLAEMQATVNTKFPWYDDGPEWRYGLGLGRLPLSCGGEYWMHPGNTLGYSHRNAYVDDGRRGVVISASTNLMQYKAAEQFEQAAHALIDNALCDVG